MSFTLSDCPAPFAPWVAGMTLPEISITLPLKSGEDLTGASMRMILTRSKLDPDNPDILEKQVQEIDNEPGQYWRGKVGWVSTDLVAGYGQEALFLLTNSLGEEEAIARFNIDVLPNTDPTP